MSASEPVPDEELLVKGAYPCLVNSVCHQLFRMALFKNTQITAGIGGKRRWVFVISSRHGIKASLAFDVNADGSKTVRYYGGSRCNADIEKVYRWAVSIAGPPPRGLLDRIAISDRPRSFSRWRWLLKVILWPFALQASLADGTFTFHWTSRRLLILLLAIGLSVAQYIGHATENPRVAFGMLIATFFLVIFTVITKNWQPHSYYFALRDMYQITDACQRYMSEYDETGNMSLVDKIERVCTRAQPAFQEIAKHHTFPD